MLRCSISPYDVNSCSGVLVAFSPSRCHGSGWKSGSQVQFFHVEVWGASNWASSSVDAKLCSLDLLAPHQGWYMSIRKSGTVQAVSFHACAVIPIFMKTIVCRLVINYPLSRWYVTWCYFNLRSSVTLINLSEMLLAAPGHSVSFCLFSSVHHHSTFLHFCSSRKKKKQHGRLATLSAAAGRNICCSITRPSKSWILHVWPLSRTQL